jgi:fermentation-respiration switch protein FrsA (DUF1100 family)
MKFGASEGEPCVLPGKEAYQEYMAFKEFAPTWKNEITLESLEKIREFDPVSSIQLMSPTALLLIPAEKDTLIPIEAVRAAYERAGEPKFMSVLPITHFEAYKDSWASKIIDLASNWFLDHL